MFVYTVVMLGSLNTVEVRLYLSVSGLVCIGMGICLALSFSSALGYSWNSMHKVLPLVCLGIGIDDMFVIVQCLNNLTRDPNYKNMKIETKLGLALRHAGVSVTGKYYINIPAKVLK